MNSVVRARAFLAFLISIVALSVVLPVRVQSRAKPLRGKEHYRGLPVVAGEVLVRFRTPGRTTPPDVHAHVDADDDEPVGPGWRRIHSRSRDVQALIAALAARGDVELVEPNYIVTADATPNDPSFGSLWGLKNNSVPGADIHATAAWDLITGSAATVVGVIDGGVDYTHPDLAANMWSAPTQFTVNIFGRSLTCPAGSHGFNSILWTCDPADDNGHGTHTSGTIGAVGNNSTGVAGVNWTTRIMAIKFLDATGQGSVSDAIDAIEFAIQVRNFFGVNGANVRVLSNSWGGPGVSTPLQDEIQRAAAAEMLFVAAAGNDSANIDAFPFSPASLPVANIVAVAATDANDALAGFSNYGPNSVHLAAPGVGILSTWPNGGYNTLSGTSMATPHVAGAAALVLAGCSLTTAQLKAALLANVDVIPSVTALVQTNGRLNVDRALRSCVTIPSVNLTSPANNSTFASPATITLSATASDPDGINRVEFYQGTTLIGTSTTAPYGGTWSNVAPGVYTITAKGYDSRGVVGVSTAARVTVTGSGAAPSASFSGVDTTTQGNWRGVYGGDGYNVINDTVQYPSYAAVTATGQSSFTWAASTADGRALQKAASTDRIAATWYGDTMSIDVTFTDVVAHQVAVYVLDWDNRGRAETLEVRNGDSNALLDTRSASGFAGGQYFRWMVTGHVRIRIINASTLNAVISGLFFDAGGGNPPPAVTLTSPVEGASFTAPASIGLTASATDADGIARVEFYQNGVLIGAPVTTSPYAISWTGVTAGSYTLTAKAYDTRGASAVSTAVHVSVTNPGAVASASFIGVDATTQGNWRGVYGADGYNVINDTVQYPSYAAVTPTGQASFTWAASTTDSRALQKAVGTDRIAATWYGDTMSIDVNISDGATHQIALYVLDWDNRGRAQTLEVRNGDTSALLDSRSVTGFASGQYWRWTVGGHVQIRVINAATPNAVISGLFFGGGGGNPPPVGAGASASFVGVDTTTQGNWRGVYGAAGYNVVNDAVNYPSFVTVVPIGQSSYTWVASTADVRALQKSTGTDRLAATWYGSTFSIDVNVTDGNVHQIALYLLDWDSSSRIEQIDILDAGTNALLDRRVISGFHNGQYVRWTIGGHVTIRVTSVGGVNGVVSGLFFS